MCSKLSCVVSRIRLKKSTQVLLLKTYRIAGNFSYGANFRIFRMMPQDTKIKTMKILTVEILTSNFDLAIEHGEAANKRWRFITPLNGLPDSSRPVYTR